MLLYSIKHHALALSMASSLRSRHLIKGSIILVAKGVLSDICQLYYRPFYPDNLWESDHLYSQFYTSSSIRGGFRLLSLRFTLLFLALIFFPFEIIISLQKISLPFSLSILSHILLFLLRQIHGLLFTAYHFALIGPDRVPMAVKRHHDQENSYK